jgi:hypothetical protein
MKMRSIGLATVLLWPEHASAEAVCQGELCGARLIAQGWQKLASCNGHAWSYLLGKGDKVVVCRGISGRAGPTEGPCDEFLGDVEKYRKAAAQVRDIGPNDCWTIVKDAGGGN